jgi:hypothetical protein
VAAIGKSYSAAVCFINLTHPLNRCYRRTTSMMQIITILPVPAKDLNFKPSKLKWLFSTLNNAFDMSVVGERVLWIDASPFVFS